MNKELPNTTNVKKDILIGYVSEPCINCGRIRVEEYVSGTLICEKCNMNQKSGSFAYDGVYSNNL